jgi:Cd2+/Zn2+-exporting ATPase
MNTQSCGNCCHCHHEHHSDGNLRQLYIAIAIFVITLFIPKEIKPFGFIISYLIAGYGVLISALRNIFTRDFFDENFLMSIATIGALCINEYPEAAMVMILYILGEYFQNKAIHRTKKSITKLMDFRQDYVNVEENGILNVTEPEKVSIGSIMIVKPGERVPLDGTVIEGNSEVDTSSLTGESIPAIIKPGDTIFSGSVNITGLLRIKVTKSYKESTVSKILKLVEYSENKKSRTENYISKFAKIYTPVVVFLALCIAIIPYVFFDSPDIKIWIFRALTFLVISCPCAFVISVPLTFFAGIGSASKYGILIKGANYIEMLSKISAIAFDKTGTLTTGKFSVVDIFPAQNSNIYEVLKYAAYAESCSNHPVAKAITEAYKCDIDSSQISNVREYSGYGIKADICGAEIIVGNKEMMEKFEIYVVDNSAGMIYVAKNNKFIGQIIVSDKIKDNAKDVIDSLNKHVSQTAILTGDNIDNTKIVAEEIGIDEYYTNLLSSDKIELIESIISRTRKNATVAFVGDGINDAPVLMRADVGIAMGALGSDAAIEAADVVIADDNIEKIPVAITVKVLFLILGAFGLMTMWGAVFADVGVTLIAVLNALRTLRINIK